MKFISVNGVNSILAKIRNNKVFDFLAVVYECYFVNCRGTIIDNPMLQEIGKTHCCRRDHLTASVVFVECLNSLDTRGVFVKKAAFAYPFALTANRRGFKAVFVGNSMFFRISCADDNVLFHLYDDRGTDLCAEKTENISHIYHDLNDLILEYDKEKIDSIFKAE